VALNLVGQRGRPEIRKIIDFANSCPPSWQLHRRWWDSDRESRRHGGKVESRGTRPRGGGSPASLSLQPQSRRGSHGESPEWPPAHRRRGSLTLRRYPSTPSANPGAGDTNHGETSSAVRSFGLIPARYCTMAIAIQSTHITSWSMIYSQFPMTTHPKLCSKIVEL
jgi:hypothetical protein